MARIARSLCQIAPKRRTGRILDYVARNRIPRAPGPPATPSLFVVSNAWNHPTRRLERTSGHLVEREGNPRTPGANGGSTRVPGAKKDISSKVVPRQLGMLEQVFLDGFEPVVTRLGPWKIPKCLENGPFSDQKWVKMGQKRVFPKVILDHLGCSNKYFQPILRLW